MAAPENKENVPPSSPLVLRAEVTLPPAEQEERRSERRRSHRLTVANLALSFLTLVVILAYALFSGMQWRELVKATRASEKAANAAKESADTLHMDQRAWIGIFRDAFINKGSSFAIPFRVTATGKTPAKDVEVRISAGILGKDEVPEFIYTGQKAGHPYRKVRVPMFFPGDERHYEVSVLQKGSGEKVVYSRQLQKDLANGAATIFIHGKITYKDIFGVAHWMTFCDYDPYRPGPAATQGIEACLQNNQDDTSK